MNPAAVADLHGLLGWVHDPFVEIRCVENHGLWLPEVSATFHGRDIFAPVAAKLSRGMPLDYLGQRIASVSMFPVPQPHSLADGSLVGNVLHVDTFGTARIDQVEYLGTDVLETRRLPEGTA